MHVENVVVATRVDSEAETIRHHKNIFFIMDIGRGAELQQYATREHHRKCTTIIEDVHVGQRVIKMKEQEKSDTRNYHKQ